MAGSRFFPALVVIFLLFLIIFIGSRLRLGNGRSYLSTDARYLSLEWDSLVGAVARQYGLLSVEEGGNGPHGLGQMLLVVVANSPLLPLKVIFPMRNLQFSSLYNLSKGCLHVWIWFPIRVVCPHMCG